jgi:protein gp37
MLDVITRTPQHHYLICTKRAAAMLEYFRNYYQMEAVIDGHGDSLFPPLPNLALGVTVCNQAEADAKIPLLLATPAAMRFVSLEPLLGPVELTPHILKCNCEICVGQKRTYLDWIISGAESGPRRRPCKIEWIERIIGQCLDSKTPVYVKQIDLGGKLITDVNKFPEHLRIQQFPEGF